MIDVENGNISFKNKNTPLNPNLERKTFIKSDLYSDIIKEEILGVYSNYYLKNQELENEKFNMTLYFKNELLEMIIIRSNPDSKLQNWKNWSEKNELFKKEKHDDWLFKTIGSPPYKYKWGEITSSFDSHSGSSSIVVRYL